MSNLIQQEEFRESHLIICEGKDDQTFFNSFILKRSIRNIQVIKHAEGNGGFKRRLMAIETAIQPTTKAILLVVDNDSNPRGNFDRVLEQIKETKLYGNPLYGVPSRRREPAQLTGRPTIGIFTLPGITGTKRGTIETMLLEVFITMPKYVQIERCLNRFVNCTDLEGQGWSISKIAKMKLRCFIAATCKDTPECKVSDMWQERRDYRDLLTNSKFDYIETFLREFATW